MRNLYAVTVVGFPESHAEPFLEAVLNACEGQVVGETTKVLSGKGNPTYDLYGAFFLTLPSDPTALARYIAARIRWYMTRRGNGSEEGSYAVSVALLKAHDHNPESPDFPPVGYYDEAIHGYL